MNIAEFTVVSDIVLQLDFMWCVVGKDYTFVIHLPEQPFWDKCDVIRLNNPTENVATVVVNMIMCDGTDHMFECGKVVLNPNTSVDVPFQVTYVNGVPTSCVEDLSDITFSTGG